MQNNTAQNTIDFLKHANYGEISSVISKIEKDFLQKHSLHRVTTGFEQEFYLSTSPSVEILDEISKIDGIFEVKKELGDNQFEITTIPQVGFVESCRIIQNFRVVAREICAKHKIEISFSATLYNKLCKMLLKTFPHQHFLFRKTKTALKELQIGIL